MRIVIDARMLYWTGVGRYTQALLQNLEELDHSNEYLVLVRRADWDKWEPKAANFKKIETNIDPYTGAEQVELARRLRKLEPDLVHFTAPNSPLLYRGRRVVTIHDLTLLDFDTSRGTGLKKALRGLKRIPFRLVFLGALSAAAILTDTKHVKHQLERRFRVPGRKITVAWLGAEPNIAEVEPINQIETGDKFLLYWGNYYKYKNVDCLIRALAIVTKKQPELKLILAGNTDYFQTELEERVTELGLRDRVVFAGFVSDGEMVGLCRAADLYVNPSLSEGFGLQGLEAMAQGLPVLSSSASCLPEVYGDAAVYFDPCNPEDLAVKISSLLDHKGLRERMANAGHERVKQFSWRKMAKYTLDVYLQYGKT